MWRRITFRLRQTWSRLSLWKRAIAGSIGLCLLIQFAFGFSLWREAKLRQQLAGRANISLGNSPLPVAIEKSLYRFVTPERLQLLAPVELVTISHPTDKDLSAISHLANIKSLRILHGNLNATELNQIGLLSQLEELELENDCIDAQSLATLSNCTRLRRLKIFGRLAPEALDPLRRSFSLNKLHLMAVRVYAGESAGLHDSITGLHLAAVARIPNLKSLVIYSPGIADTDLNPLASAERMEELFVSQMQIQSRSLDGLGQMPGLKRLTLEIGVARYVEPLRGFPSLTSLGLHGARISREFLSSLKQLPHLETLSLERCWVNDNLFALADNSQLKRLNLQASDANIEGIRRIGRLDSLEVLDASGFPILEEVEDLFPGLKANSHFNWDAAMMKDSGRHRRPIVGGGFF